MTSAFLLATLVQPKEITIRLPEAPKVVRWIEGGKKLIMVFDGSLREWPSGRTLLLPYEVTSDYGTSRVDAIFNADKTLLAYALDGHRATVVDLKKWTASTVPTYSYQIAFKGRELVSLDYEGKDDNAVIRSKTGDEWLPKGHFIAGLDPLCRFAFATTGTDKETQIIAYRRDPKGIWSKFAESTKLPGEYVSGNWYDYHEPSKTISFTSFWDTGATWAATGIMRPNWRGVVIAQRNDQLSKAIQPPRWIGDQLLVPMLMCRYQPETGPFNFKNVVRLYDNQGHIKRVLYESNQPAHTEVNLRSVDYDPKMGRLALSTGSDSSGTVTIRKL